MHVELDASATAVMHCSVTDDGCCCELIVQHLRAYASIVITDITGQSSSCYTRASQTHN
jgi:hypothetical protein